MHLAHVTAMLTAYAPAKSDKFVKIEKLLHKPGNTSHAPPQTAEQQIAVLRSIMAGRKR